MRVALHHNRHDWHASLHGQMERTLLERQHLRLIGVASRALGEDEDALAVVAHFVGGAVERLDGRLAVGAVDEHGAGEGHEPAQDGHMAQGLLGRDAAVGREDGAQHQHVQLRLVVRDEDGGPRGEVFVAGDDLELHAGGAAHDPLEAARGGPLRDAAVADQTEDDRGDYPVGSAEKKRAVGCQAASNERGAGDLLTDSEEGQRDDDKRADARGDIREERHGEREDGV